jgi:hypothetical protein
MNAEIFAEWLRRQGHRVVRTASSYWYDAGHRVFQAFPYHWIIKPSEEELRTLLLENNAIALRYSAPITASRGKVSYHVICEDPNYDVASLRRQVRQNVRRGLEFACMERIPISRLATEGWPLRRDSLERQGRTGAETESYWRRLCMSAQDLPGFEAWGAIRQGELVASFLALRCEDCYTLPHEQSATAHLESRVNNAIFYFVTHQALKLDAVSRVFFCVESLDAPSSVNEFKFRMGYTPEPVRQRVVFHPWLAPVFNRVTHAAVRWLFGRWPSKPSLAKAEGMLRFYLQGRRPLNDQDWPECLIDRKIELFEEVNSHNEIRVHQE